MEETIAAISTAYGEGGIGIVRISGEDTLPLFCDVFEPASKGGGESETKGNADQGSESIEMPSRLMRYGHVMDRETGERIDECMAVLLKGPKTYTTEDMAEIYCHGSVVALRKTLALVLKRGARLAEPGEFTKRAFLGGRLDLSQAEAVIDMIRARTDAVYDMAMAQLEGVLSLKIRDLRKELLDLLVNITVNIDYPEEDIEELTLKNVSKELSSIGDALTEIVENSTSGRMIREGIKLAIAGRPNVGKSSLMNALLRENRAIVTHIPGTTRDTIEEAASIRGLPVIIIDTAGIHDTQDEVESLGIERSRDAFSRADFMILVMDGGEEMTAEDEMLLAELGEKPYLIVINKEDLEQKLDEEKIREILPGADIVHTSAPEARGIDRIEDRIEELVYGGRLHQKDSILVSNVRHVELLREALEDIERGKAMADRGEALDLIEVDVRAAYDELGQIIGETVSDEVLDEVFSRFCLGK